MPRAVLVLANETIRNKALAWIRSAPLNSRVEFKAPARSGDQNAKMWCMLTEVACQVMWRDLLGRPRRMTTDEWKIFFLDMLNSEAVLVPNSEGTGYVNVGRASSDLAKDEFSDLIELIYKFGAERGVTFVEPQRLAA